MAVGSDRRAIALARVPSLVRHAARNYRRLTGLTVVSTVRSASADRPTRPALSPPVHPLCAKRLRSLPYESPCRQEWGEHLQFAAKRRCSRVHTCGLGLRCAGVTIVLGDELIGLAKCVCSPEITKERFRALVGLLEDMIARQCLELQVSLLRDEIDALDARVNRLLRVHRAARPAGNRAVPRSAMDRDGDPGSGSQAVIRQVLDYLGQHFDDRALSLADVANAVGRNQKYVTHLFVMQVGERMRAYITRLRVRRACELLLRTNASIGTIARESGFARPVQFRHSFRTTVGVTATEYRRIFAPRARD